MPGMMASRFCAGGADTAIIFVIGECTGGWLTRCRRSGVPTSDKTYCLEPVAWCAWWLPPSKKLPQLRTSKPDAVSVILK